MNYRIGQLILSPASKNNTISEVFVAEPDHEKESLAGKLFILIEMDTKRSDGLKLANFIVNYINNSYYQNEKLILKEKIPSLRVEHIFESVISRANKKIIEFIKEQKIKINLNSLNSTIGLIYDDEIHFSSSGKNRALLIYKKIENGKKSYKTIDLNKDNENTEKEEGKIFANVVSGNIPEGSSFIFSNEALPEYLSPKQLSDITIKLPPGSAVEQMKNTLSQINEYIPFNAIIIKSSKLEMVESEKRPASTEQESINRLNSTEEETEGILSPSGTFGFKKYAQEAGSLIAGIFRRTDQAKSEQLFIKPGGKISPRVLKFYFKKVKGYLKSFALNIINFLFYIFKLIANAKKIKGLKQTAKDYSFSAKDSLQKKDFSFKKKYKIIFLILLISVFGIYYELDKSKKQKAAEEQLAYYNELKESIELKQNQADANLLYNNSEGAKELFSEIKNLLEEYPQKTEEQKSEYSEFQNKLNEQIDKVRNLVKIPDDSFLFDFSQVNKNAKIDNIVLAENNIYASDPDQDSIYIYNIDTKEVTTITDLENNLQNITNPTLNDNSIYWLGGEQIIKLNLENEEVSRLNLEKSDQADIAAMASYGGRTYMLDPSNSQIYRYGQGDDGFLQYSNWLNDDLDLANSRDIAIDGFIYSLDNNGEIKKLFSGESEEFVQDLVEPEIKDAIKIITTVEGDNLYVLDKTSARIIVFKKDGEFIKQYEAGGVQEIKDFSFDEQRNIFYFLSGSSLYKFLME